MKKITVLGAGLVGRPMAIDLCRDYEVTSVDLNQEVLDRLAAEHPVKTKTADLSDPAVIAEVVADADLVVGAVPGFMGFGMLKAVIEAGKDIVDISFFEEDPFLLDDLAKEKGVTAVVDCGVAPGMSNIILGRHSAEMKIDRYECYVGGLPKIRTRPFEYKAPFSPVDVIAEYTRPARLVLDGKVVIKPALSEVEPMDFEEIGTLEAFNTDGLRSLIKTMDIPNMVEKTLRYPGHTEIMRLFRETGFFDETPIRLNGSEVRPIDLTAALLFPKWALRDKEEDLTILKLIISGQEDGRKKRYTYSMLDRYNAETGTPSMARTTGYTCTAVARLILDGSFERKGICPPEYVGQVEGCLERVINDLKDRGVVYRLEAGE